MTAGTSSQRPTRRRRFALSLAAAGLLTAAIWLPFWRVDLRAPQYPNGLQMVAYGSEVRGDLREINIINHYVGMEHIDTAPAPEMALFPLAMATVILLALIAPLHRRLAQLAVIAVSATPIVILVDLQRWLYKFGRNLDPRAPLRVEPFTPWVIGISKIGNFSSTGMVSWGCLAMVAAAALLYWGLRIERQTQRLDTERSRLTAPATGLLGAVLLLGGLSAGPMDAAATPVRQAVEITDLQAHVDRAPAGSTLRVPAGHYRGPLKVRGPLTLIAEAGAVIDGDGSGSVVEISGDGVTLRGFTVRHSGRSITAEPAGIKVTGSGHTIEENVVTDVYFGIHLAGGGANTVRSNRIEPGTAGGVRPGHAISLWHETGSRVIGNRISGARDGVYLSFADDVVVGDNVIRGCRYAVHSMYSERSTFVRNRLEDNLLGAALMYSNGLVMRCNRIEHHRRGATAYGVLLKDIDDLLMEGNVIAANRVGIYADSTPLGSDHEALVRDNLLHGNHAALALHSNVGLTFHDNRLIGNLIDVRSEGRGLSASNRWSVAGRGNYWDTYGGYDRDADGIGDLSHRYEEVMSELIERSPLIRAFAYTPAAIALERAARLFPLYRPEPLVVDGAPLMDFEALDCRGVVR